MYQIDQLTDDIKFRGVLLDHADRLRRFIESRISPKLGQVIATEDVLQEVWLAAFRGSGRFIPDGQDALARWLTRITERKILDAIRRARKLRRGGGSRSAGQQNRSSSYLALFAHLADSSQRTPSSEDAAKEAVHAVETAVRGLPQDHRRAVTMYYIDGRSYAEVAERMGRTCPDINSLLYRSRTMLRKRLGPAGKFFTDVTSSEEA